MFMLWIFSPSTNGDVAVLSELTHFAAFAIYIYLLAAMRRTHRVPDYAMSDVRFSHRTPFRPGREMRKLPDGRALIIRPLGGNSSSLYLAQEVAFAVDVLHLSLFSQLQLHYPEWKIWV